MILGVVRGWKRLGDYAKTLTKDLTNQAHEDYSDQDLEKFLKRTGLGYNLLYNMDLKAYVCEDRDGNGVRFVENPNLESDLNYWTRSWDRLIENKATGNNQGKMFKSTVYTRIPQ